MRKETRSQGSAPNLASSLLFNMLRGKTESTDLVLVISCTFGHVWMSRPFWWAMPLLWKCPTRVVWLTSSPWRPLLLLKLVSEISREQRETASLWCGCFKASLQLPVRASPFGTAHKPRKEIIGPDDIPQVAVHVRCSEWTIAVYSRSF